MTPPTPIAIYIDAEAPTLPLILPDKAQAGYLCPRCRKAWLSEGGRHAEACAAAVSCCWCSQHDEVKDLGQCWTCARELQAKWLHNNDVDKLLEAAAVIAPPTEPRDLRRERRARERKRDLRRKWRRSRSHPVSEVDLLFWRESQYQGETPYAHPMALKCFKDHRNWWRIHTPKKDLP